MKIRPIPLAPPTIQCPGISTSADEPVTFRADGTVLSTFGADLWDFSAYSGTRGKRTLFFLLDLGRGLPPDQAELSCLQLKQLIFHLFHDRKLGISSWSYIKEKFSALAKFAKYAAKQGLTLFEAIQSPNVILWMARDCKNHVWAAHFRAALSDLYRLGPQTTGLSIPLSQVAEVLSSWASLAVKLQHPPIPTRIYSQFIFSLNESLCSYEAIQEDFQSYLKAGLAAEFAAPPSSELVDYFSKNDVVAGQQGTFWLISRLSALFDIIITTFSGMRAEEVESLPFNCLEKASSKVEGTYFIRGRTTKLHKGVKRATWITSELGARAIRAAQGIYGILHSVLGDGKQKKSKDGSHLLICRLGNGGRGYVAGLAPSGMHLMVEAVSSSHMVEIEAEDIAELKEIDPARDWEAKFRVGEKWHFTRHQARRSLALYAHASGLVSLPSLKRQLQQLTRAMARYYAKGSLRAKNILVAGPPHFSQEWRAGAALSKFLAYSKLMFSGERLFGGHADWVRAPSVQRSPVSVTNRERTLKAFEKGEISFTPTPFGGCTNPEPCEISPLEWLPLDCLEKNCRHQVGVVGQLKAVVISQERLVSTLNKRRAGSVEHRFETRVLERLKKVEEKYDAQ